MDEKRIKRKKKRKRDFTIAVTLVKETSSLKKYRIIQIKKKQSRDLFTTLKSIMSPVLV